MNSYTIRVARKEDAEGILGVYAYYVENTAISFECEVPSVEEFQRRIQNTLVKYPYYVAEDENGNILGYCYAGPFKGRAAYDWGVETTIYVRKDCRKSGLGRCLYEKLEDTLKAQNFLNANACIATCDREDEHLNNNSMQFHDHMGYRLVGQFTQCGFKFHTWYNMVWMEKMLGEHPEHPKAVIPFSELKKA